MKVAAVFYRFTDGWASSLVEVDPFHGLGNVGGRRARQRRSYSNCWRNVSGAALTRISFVVVHVSNKVRKKKTATQITLIGASKLFVVPK